MMKIEKTLKELRDLQNTLHDNEIITDNKAQGEES